MCCKPIHNHIILFVLCYVLVGYFFYFEEGSNASTFCASIMPQFLKTLITQNLNLKIQNKTVEYELHHFIYACVKINYGISTLFWLSS